MAPGDETAEYREFAVTGVTHKTSALRPVFVECPRTYCEQPVLCVDCSTTNLNGRPCFTSIDSMLPFRISVK